MTADEAWSLAVVVLAIMLGLKIILLFVLTQGHELWRWWIDRRKRKIAVIEAELDRKAEELQQEIYEMASQLRLGSQKAREDMIREAYRRAGRVPREGSEPRNRPPRK